MLIALLLGAALTQKPVPACTPSSKGLCVETPQPMQPSQGNVISGNTIKAPQKVKVNFYQTTVADQLGEKHKITIYGWCDSDYSYNNPNEAHPDLDIKFTNCTTHYVLSDEDGDE